MWFSIGMVVGYLAGRGILEPLVKWLYDKISELWKKDEENGK